MSDELPEKIAVVLEEGETEQQVVRRCKQLLTRWPRCASCDLDMVARVGRQARECALLFNCSKCGKFARKRPEKYGSGATLSQVTETETGNKQPKAVFPAGSSVSSSS